MPEHWRASLRAAARLRIAPAAFWRLSLREWRALNHSVPQAMSRAGFDMLAAQFPDEPR